MRFMMLVAALATGIGSPVMAAEPAPANAFWQVSNERLSFKPAQLSVPRRAAGAEYFETTEFSHNGEGVDTAIKYRSADQSILATLYVYYPSFSHAGVQSIATDQAIRGNARSPQIRALGSGVAAAAGKPGLALTADYENYLGDNYSKAAFVKADRWMLKVRVTGPETRKSEVDAVMKALLDGLRFEGKVQPLAAAPIAAGQCKPGDRPAATIVAGGGGEAASVGILDAAGQRADNARPGDNRLYLGRVGRNWCQTLLQVGDRKTAVLEATGKAGSEDSSALLFLYSDSGGVLEVVRLAKERKYVLLHHDIAEVKVLESYDRLPSRAQIARLFSGTAPTNIRARVRLKPDAAAQIELPGAQTEPAR